MRRHAPRTSSCTSLRHRALSSYIVAPSLHASSNLLVPRPRASPCHIGGVILLSWPAGVLWFGVVLSSGQGAVPSGGAVFVYAQRAFSRLIVFLLRVSVRFLGWCCSFLGPACISLGMALFSFTPSVRFLGCSCFRCVSACVFSGGVVPSSGWREFSRGGAVFVYAQLAFFRLVVVMFRFCVPFIGRCCFRLRSACAFMVDRVFCFGPACVLSGGADPSSGRRAYSWGVAVFTHARRAFSLLITLLSRIGVFFSGGVAPSSGQRAFLRLALFSFTPSVRFHG